jgi:hypothetical protein
VIFGQLWFGLAAVAASLVVAQVIWGATSDADQDLGTVGRWLKAISLVYHGDMENDTGYIYITC